MSVEYRPEQPDDADAIRRLHEIAFDRSTEAKLVDSLRAACPETISLVAEKDGEVVGHVLFSPVIIEDDKGPVEAMGLAPVAVLPEHRQAGVGSGLVEEGIGNLRSRSCPAVIVLGYPEFYARFGFLPASHFGVSCQWTEVPDEAFMVLVLDKLAMADVTGVARYRSEFDEAV